MSAVFFAEMIARLLALQALIHGIEFLQLAGTTGDQGVWRWPELEAEFGTKDSVIRVLLRTFLAGRNFQWLNWFRIVVAVTQLVAPSAVGLALLFAVHFLTMLRWLGAFNGGSDSMNLLVLLATSLALAFDRPRALGATSELRGLGPTICLWYIAAQACLSYLKAGWVKVVNPAWRDGQALKDFIQSPTYAGNLLADEIANSFFLRRAVAWSVIIFELTFPLCLFGPHCAILYLTLGLLFHLGNAYLFGLNRFLFAWLAAYPALYFCSLFHAH